MTETNQKPPVLIFLTALALVCAVIVFAAKFGKKPPTEQPRDPELPPYKEPAALLPTIPDTQPAAGSLSKVIIDQDKSIIINLSSSKHVQPPFQLSADPEAAGGQCIEVPPKAGKSPGLVKLQFENLHKGRYSLYLRAFWGSDGEKACSNSIFLNLNNSGDIKIQDSTWGSWHWVSFNPRGKANDYVILEKGLQTLVFHNREDGVKFDQIFLTPWFEDEYDRRIPTGIEGTD